MMNIMEPYLHTRSWRFTDTETGTTHRIKGMLLGAATSQRPQHNHPGERQVQGGIPCHACRWFEVRIIVTEDEEYIVSYQGYTTIEDETHRSTVHRTRSPHTVIEVLTQVRNKEAFIPRTSRIALSEAAGRDDGIEQAWVDRAVVA